MNITRFLSRREWELAAVAVVAIVAQVWLDLKLPDYMQSVTKVIVSPDASVTEVLHEGAFMLGCALGSMLAAVITGFCMAIIGATLAMRMRQAVFDRTTEFSMEEFNKFGSSSLITRSTNDVTQVQMFITMGMQILVKSPILAIWAITKMAGKNLTWTAATGVTVVILLIIMAIILRLVMPRMMRMQRITDDLNRVTREHLGGLRVIRAHNAQEFHEQRFEYTNKELTGTNLFVMRTMAIMMPMMTAIMSGLSLVIYALGASMIDAASAPQDRITLFSEMIVFSSYAMQVIGAFMMMVMAFFLMPRALVSYRRISEVLKTKPSIIDGPVRGPENDKDMQTGGTIEFQNVSFRYPDAEDDALHDITFTIEPGQTVALIGATGSGKSSIVNLIPRLFDVSGGKILVDGIDVKEWKQSSLRDRIGYAAQKATLFSGTIASNIDYGSSQNLISPETVVKAAHIAHADEFIASKEDHYASPVAQGGQNLSGGQKQRVSIARAVARGANIMIFDDAFSALDYRTDRDVRASLKEEAAGATVLIVAQRIGTVRGADRILVIDHGRVVGSGSHDELMAENDVYRQIALSQLSEEELV